jgi:FixJ family two-component response regulator
VCKKAISIIDDDEMIRGAISSLVRSLGCRARVFESAGLFLASDVSTETMCLICDVQMPDMTGIELQRYLIHRNLAIPTIFITAYSSARLRETLLANGALCLLEKPLDASELASWLARVLKST